ncbi:MAG: serine/threonine-protein kinase [Burkholderiaceae bacterium]
MSRSPADLSTLSRLLDEALDLEPAQAEAWLAALPAAHRHLLPQLRVMLDEHRSPGHAGFMSDGPKLEDGPVDETVARPDELVGPYRLIREIGRGGMGAVWLAERADGSLKRHIALKLPRLAWGAGLAERMARERDIGALLEHPNIARLYDAGVDATGRPYLALEYIDGQPLDAWCAAQALGVPERLRLFLQVARAVAYAHGRLVVHRDLKPSNVLVTADGQAHLLDFGIAKLLHDAVPGDLGLTQEQGRVLTPHYASPEQIQGETITVASDVYSLGVLLYELLTRRLPFHATTPAALEAAVLEGTRPLASSHAPDKATARALRGEIDAILGKALRRVPTQRYASVDALAQDIERHLLGDTVLARPDSALYRLRKALRRNWLGVSTAAAVLVAVLGGSGAAVLQAQRAQATRAMAETARGESERLIVYLLDDLYRELQPVGRLDLVGEMAKRALDYYRALPAELRSAETERNQALAQVRYGAVLRVQSRIDDARAVVSAAVATLERLRDRGDSSEAAAIGLALGLTEQSRAVTPAGKERHAVPPAERAVSVLATAAAASGASVALRRAHAAALTQLGMVHARQRRFDPGVAALEAALATWRGIDPLMDDSDAAANFGITTARLVEAYDSANRPADAARAGEEGLRATSTLIERQPTNMLALRARASISDSLAAVARNQLQPGRRLAAANDAARDWALLSRIDSSDAFSKNSLIVARREAAYALWDQGRPRESLAKVLENGEFGPAAESLSVVAAWLYFSVDWAAAVAAELGEATAADKYLADRQHLFEISMRSDGPPSFLLQYFRVQTKIQPVELAMLLADLPRARAAAKGLREQLLALPATNDFERLRVAAALSSLHTALGWVALQARDFATAQDHFGRVAETRTQLPVETLVERREAADEAALLAITLAHAGRLDEARALAAPALALQREIHARQTDDQMHKLGLVLALVAAAWSTPDQASVLLVQAQVAFDSLPTEARELRSSRLLQGLIADARRTGPSR